ncbi:MAG TPA: dTDP-4-dehydrorhamnose reductase [Alcaligenes faecalis]|nr:dTDP-4-dehydrorhamnose reductase [Alcaligenes faecalis]
MKRILVTGAQGQLGQALAYCDTKVGHSSGYLGAPPSAQSQAEEHWPPTQKTRLMLQSRHELDITQPDSIAQTLETLQPAVVINAAAYTAVDQAESEPHIAHLLNGLAPGLLAQACAERGIAMVHVSTDYVFDGLASLPYAEDAATSPISVYGQSKLEGELAVFSALPSAVVLRTSRVFSQFGTNFLKTMLRLGRERHELSIVIDQSGGPSYAPHIAQVLLTLADRLIAANRSDSQADTPAGVYHFAGQPNVSWYGFAQEIFSQAIKLGLLSHAPALTAISTKQYPTPAQRPAQSGLQQSRLNTLLGVENIERNWHEGIEKTLLALKTAP